jgi:hypothetical protein
MNQTQTIEKLRKLILTNAAAKSIMTWAAGRDKNSTATSLDRICRKVKLEKDDAVQALQQFEKLGVGKYIIGRKDNPTRFEWHFGLVTVGMAARGKSDAREVLGATVDEGEEETATVVTRKPATAAAESRQASEARTMTNMGATLFLQVPASLSAAKLKQIQEILAS